MSQQYPQAPQKNDPGELKEERRDDKRDKKEDRRDDKKDDKRDNRQHRTRSLTTATTGPPGQSSRALVATMLQVGQRMPAPPGQCRCRSWWPSVSHLRCLCPECAR
jgi:hypothetical protein